MALIMALNIIFSIYISSETENSELVKLNYKQSIIEPINDFLSRFGIKMASILLLIIATYRLTDIVMGPMANPFYIDMGYSKTEIGAIVKTVALGASILGFFVGGQFIKRFSLKACLLFGGVLVPLAYIG